MAKALNHFFGGKWKRRAKPEVARARTPLVQQSLFWCEC